MINGVARYGAPALVEQFSTPTERLSVGGSDRALFLTQPTGDAVVGALTLADATQTLADGLQRLPQLAADLEALGSARGIPAVGDDAPEGQWVLELDQNRDDELFDALARGLPLSQVLTPMDLDPLLIVDDEHYLARIASQRNLAAALKAELPHRLT